MVAALRKGEFCSEPARATIPHNFEMITAEGWTCPVRRSPGDAFGLLLRGAPGRALVGMHGLLTETDLLVWQSTTLLHADVERVAGLRGVRIMLRNSGVRVENETVAMPERFPWLFPDAVRTAELEVEERRQAVAAWLTTNRRLCVLYPSGVEIDWYAEPAALPAATMVTLPPG
jgi:hypothetical protein